MLTNVYRHKISYVIRFQILKYLLRLAYMSQRKGLQRLGRNFSQIKSQSLRRFKCEQPQIDTEKCKMKALYNNNLTLEPLFDREKSRNKNGILYINEFPDVWFTPLVCIYRVVSNIYDVKIHCIRFLVWYGVWVQSCTQVLLKPNKTISNANINATAIDFHNLRKIDHQLQQIADNRFFLYATTANSNIGGLLIRDPFHILRVCLLL